MMQDDAVERAARAIARLESYESDWRVWVNHARAALAAARAGGDGVTVTAAQVERRAREKADAEAVVRGALPCGDTSWAHVRTQYIGPLRADLIALGIEVQR